MPARIAGQRHGAPGVGPGRAGPRRAAEGTTAVLNAANEVAVGAFLSGRLRFDHIHAVNLATLDAVSPSKPDSLAALLDLDTQARHAAEHVAGRLAA